MCVCKSECMFVALQAESAIERPRTIRCTHDAMLNHQVVHTRLLLRLPKQTQLLDKPDQQVQEPLSQWESTGDCSAVKLSRTRTKKQFAN